MDLPQLKTSLKAHEGFRGQAYADTKGKQTIGFGRNLTDNPLTEEEAWYLSQLWINDAIVHAPLLVHAWDKLGDARQNVLIELIYNIGIVSALKFQKMRVALDAGHWFEAADELLDSQWAKDVGSHRAGDMATQLRTGNFV